MNFKEKRQHFYSKIPEFWADLYGQEYGLFDVKVMDEEFAHDTKKFARKAGHIFFKTTELLQSKEIPDSTFLQMGYPSETLPFLRLGGAPFNTVIGRFDSVVINQLHKILEFNSDTPTFIYELFKVNGMVCKEFGFKNPNEQEETLLKKTVKKSIMDAFALLKQNHFPNIVFTSHNESIEDRNTVIYLQELSGLPSQYVPLDQLRIMEGEALLDPEGIPIDVLYRQTFPIESMIFDVDPDTSAKVGEQLLNLVALNKLAIINPPSAFLMQNKALMSVIWGLHEEGSPFFTSEEHVWIEEHFLPTYLEPDPFINRGEKYVQKPVFGREGDTVEIFDGTGAKVDENQHKSYSNYLSVYQKFVELPTTKIRTEAGESEGHFMVGTFLLNGSPSAFGFRVGNQITNNLSYFLPVGINK
ncbi:glutathionylspermidine synthase family protein [Bacillus sp. DJP31]|uniref:glutathionylspermidine synthase family protein n=1 Tax=Bacillus sp. DJP31 TaxID=3409789 RepID=UPI003BB6AA94